jgi:hypothetical protein
MSGWFSAQIVHDGRLPLFCFFVAFVAGFAGIRLSVRMIRAGVRWWFGNVTAGSVHVHHMVFGVVMMGIGGIAGLAAPAGSVGWRAAAAAIFGLGLALVLDEFALILHLRDVYWANEGRVSVDAVFVAAGLTALLLIGASPIGVRDVADYHHMPGGSAASATLVLVVAVLFVLAGITLLKGKGWTAIVGIVLPIALIVGAVRLARPGSPWARWRYRKQPAKLAKAVSREQRLTLPAIRFKNRLQDLLAGRHEGQPELAQAAKLARAGQLAQALQALQDIKDEAGHAPGTADVTPGELIDDPTTSAAWLGLQARSRPGQQR